MAYIPPSLSGFNASPPPDDGSQVESNSLQWARDTVAKIGNPLKTFAEAINTAVKNRFDVTPDFSRTATEISAGVMPTNFLFEPGDVRRYGSSNNAARVQDAINSGHKVFVPDGTYAFGTTTVTFGSNLRFEGESREGVKFTYSGTSFAFDGFSANFLQLRHFFVDTRASTSATGIRLGNSVQQLKLLDVRFQGDGTTSNTGTGILLDAGSAGNFSGNLVAELCYCIGYKFGVRVIGTDTTNTWTTFAFTDCFLIGRAAGPISGSVGISNDANTNAVGSYFRGGTIESYATGYTHEDGAANHGMDILCDMEGNTTDFTVGASFRGRIRTPTAGNTLIAGTNAGLNPWYLERRLSGAFVSENWSDFQYMIYDHGGAVQRWELFRGPVTDSIINGGSPVSKFAIQADDSTDQGGQTNWLELNTHKITWHSAVPNRIGSNWQQGDVIWNSDVIAAGSPGWLTTSSGTFSAATDATGDTDGSTAVITGMTDTSDFAVKNFVTVSAGFAAGPHLVIALTSTTMTLDVNSTSSQTNVTVSTPDPVFKAMANVAA